MHRRPAAEGGEQRVELRERERAVEHVEHGALDESLDDAFFRDVTDGLELDLAGGRSDDGGQIADARDDAGLAGAQRTLQRAPDEVLVVRDGNADRHTGALRELRRSARELREL